MKKTRIIIIITIITCLIIFYFYIPSVNAEVKTEIDTVKNTITKNNKFFPKLTIVINKLQINPETWAISCLDRQGDEWIFYCDDNTWECGDIVNLLMWTVDEELQIYDVYWEGYTEDINIFLYLTEWQ